MPPITATFRTAQKTDMGWSYMPMDKPVLTVLLTATTFPGLGDEVRAHVATLGHHCAVYLQLPRGQRKPNGWDRFTSRLHFVECKAHALIA